MFSDLTLACAYGTLGGTDRFSGSDASKYSILCGYGPCGIAVDDDGVWGAGCGFTDIRARVSAISACQSMSGSPETCAIVDLNQKSDFIKDSEQDIFSEMKSDDPGVDEADNIAADSVTSEAQEDTNQNLSTSPGSLTIQLRQLRALVDEGLITEEDYEQVKKQILDGM